MAEIFFGITDKGKVRDNNEDAFIAEKLSGGLILACVIDGVGGYEGGEVAAAIARDSILNKLQQSSTDIIQSLKESVKLANKNIYNEKLNGRGNSQMACVLTLALVDVESNQFYYAHVGDTRMYLLRDQSLIKVTNDHSFVGFLEDSGRLSEKEAMSHPKRNEINKALGFDAQMETDEDYIETGSSPFLPGDMLMLCSDGLTDMVNNGGMTSILVSSTTLQKKGEALIAAANKAGGKDNITVVLVKNDKKPLKQKATKPGAAKKAESEEVAVVSSNDTPTPTNAPSKKKRGNTAVWAFALLSLLLGGACYWLWNKNKELEAALPKPEPPKTSIAAELILRERFKKNDTILHLSDTAFKRPVIIKSSIPITQDSLHVVGNKIVIESDSSYKGPAFIIADTVKYILLENITFKNFSMGIIVKGKGLTLKDVRFENTQNPILYVPTIPRKDTIKNMVITFRAPDFISKDSSNRQ